MTRMQVLARALLNGLCFLGIGFYFVSFRYADWMFPPERMWIPLLIAAFTGAVSLWLFLYGLNRFQLAIQVAGHQREETNPPDKRFFVSAVRLASVSAGLLLLAWFPEAVSGAIQQAARFVDNGRDFFQSLSAGNFSSAMEQAAAGGLRLLYPIGLCVWIAYLLTGTPRIIRSQLRLFEAWNKQVRSQI